MSNNDKKGGAVSLWFFLVAAMVAGFLTHLLIIVPIKTIRWLKVDKDMRRSWFFAVSPFGADYISFRGLISYAIYGIFWLMIAIIIGDAHDYFTRGHSVFTSGQAGVGPAIMLIGILTVGFLGMSIWWAYCDINETDYEREYDGTISKREQAERAIREEVERRIQKIENEKQIAAHTKSLNETKIEDCPF
jgi:hypothetical protein